MKNANKIPHCIVRQLSALQTCAGKNPTYQEWKQIMVYVEISYMLLDEFTSNCPILTLGIKQPAFQPSDAFNFQHFCARFNLGFKNHLAPVQEQGPVQRVAMGHPSNCC